MIKVDKFTIEIPEHAIDRVGFNKIVFEKSKGNLLINFGYRGLRVHPVLSKNLDDIIFEMSHGELEDWIEFNNCTIELFISKYGLIEIVKHEQVGEDFVMSGVRFGEDIGEEFYKFLLEE